MEPLTAGEGMSPVSGILRDASMVDYPGRMAAVLFLGGCNFRCGFCHNPELMRGARAPRMPWREVEEICRRFRANWTDGAVVTGGEPTLQEDIFHTVEKLREWGFHVKLDTNGSRPRVLERLLPLVEYVAMDVKAAPGEYEARTGFGDVAAVGESIALLREGKTAYEFRTTVLEAWHGEEQMREIGRWVEGAALWVLQAFVPREGLPDPACRTMRETPKAHMRQMAEVARAFVRKVEIRGEF